MSQAPPKLTPMYEQYLSIKEQYPDALLFYRMGDFYELFFDDAPIAARELQLALTSRSKEEGGIPMCGVPWHALTAYTSQLLEKGYKVAICDQVEDPRTAKGLVKREVTRVLTPGTVLDEANLEAKAHTYLGAIYLQEGSQDGGFAWMDVSTGAWTGLQSARSTELWQWVLKLSPRELIIPESMDIPSILKGQQEIQLVRVPFRSHFDIRAAKDRVLAVQKVQDLAALGLEKRVQLTQACGALVVYLEQTQMQNPSQLTPFRPMDLSRHMLVDEMTERNLELFRRLDGRKGPGTLWHVLDETRTPMGGRLLEERMHYPWREKGPIIESQQAVAWFCQGEQDKFCPQAEEMRKNLRQTLDAVYDVERLSTRISLGRCQPKDMLALRQSLQSLPLVRQSLRLAPQAGQYPTADNELNVDMPQALNSLLKHWDDLGDIYQLLEAALLDNLPPQITDGGLFRQGYHAKLDEWLDLVNHGEGRLQALLLQEQAACGLAKLKLGFNRVFGYYFEISKGSMPAQLPAHFERKQSLVNAERFTTTALKELEERLLSASEERKSLEYQLYQDLRQKLGAERPRLLFMADLLAQLDYWQSLAESAVRNKWCCPTFVDTSTLHIKAGRHPVVEKILGQSAFIPNDLHMDEKRRLLIITGPNMAGKSTVLRQSALIVLLAQMGSFVPATSAEFGLVDRIFSRVGASDNLAQGQSTFMVEMMETARILRQSTKRSFVILDEIGRGTSTFDGLALAWAVVEDLAHRSSGQIRTLFATHYHEITALEGQVPGVHNMNIAIREWNNDIIFLRRLIPGPADRSYGIEVARLAGVPMPVVNRAKEVLSRLEQNRGRAGQALLPGLSIPSPEPTVIVKASPALPPLIQTLRDTDVSNLTPLAALTLLTEWKELWGNAQTKLQEEGEE